MFQDRKGETSEQGVSPFFWLRLILKFGATSFVLWFLYSVCLAPLWGEHILNYREVFLKKIELLKDQGLSFSPSLRIISEAGAAEVFGAGSLLGFLFYALPFALYFSLAELISSQFKRMVSSMLCRTIAYILFIYLYSDEILIYSENLVVLGIAFLSLATLPYVVCSLYDYFELRSRPLKLKKTLLVFALVLAIASPYLIHPYLYIISDIQGFREKNSFEVIENGKKENKEVNLLTLFRDWVLLDKKGSHFFNNWYYSYTAFAAEEERITHFQALMVGYCKLPYEHWKSALHFSSRIKRGQDKAGVKFLELKSIAEAIDLKNEGLIDMLVLSPESDYSLDQLQDNFDEEQVLWCSDKEIDENDYFGKVVYQMSYTPPRYIQNINESRVSLEADQVAYCQLDYGFWKFYFDRCFKRKAKTSKGKTKYIEADSLSQALEWLRDGDVDLILLNQNKKYDKSELKESDKVIYLSRTVDDLDLNFMHPTYYLSPTKKINYFVKSLRDKMKPKQTFPLVLERERLKEQGFHHHLEFHRDKYKRFLGSLINDSYTLTMMLIVLLSGFLYFLFNVFIAFGQNIPWLPLGLFIYMSPSIYHSLVNHGYFWLEISYKESKDYKSKEMQILKYNRMSLKASESEISEVLNLPLAVDTRVAMWQFSVLGDAYLKLQDQNLLLEIENKFLLWSQDYHNWPLNKRYKFIQALAKIPRLYERVELIAKEEKQLYVRWYIESFGFGKVYE